MKQIIQFGPYKQPRFNKYVLQKVKGLSRQRYCLIFDLKESKFAEALILWGSKFHICLALCGIEF